MKRIKPENRKIAKSLKVTASELNKLKAINPLATFTILAREAIKLYIQKNAQRPLA